MLAGYPTGLHPSLGQLAILKQPALGMRSRDQSVEGAEWEQACGLPSVEKLLISSWKNGFSVKW